jgi:hypothetical protein
MTKTNGARNPASKPGADTWSTSRLAPRTGSFHDLSVTYEGYSEDVITRPPDISTRGMFINTNRSLPEGAVLNVRFRLTHSGVEIRSRCEVRYCLPGVGVGVEFIDIEPDAVRAIEEETKQAAGRAGVESGRKKR